jgi:predicted ester cyclase
MKWSTLLILPLFMFYFSTCDLCDKSCNRKIEEQNKDVVRKTHDEVWSKGNIALIDELYAPDYVGHWAEGTDTQGLEELKKIILKNRMDFPDYIENIEQIIAEGNLVVTRFRGSGTFKGAVERISPTNKRVTNQEIAIYRIVKGKIVEQWTVANTLLLMQQLGISNYSQWTD